MHLAVDKQIMEATVDVMVKHNPVKSISWLLKNGLLSG